MPYGTTAYAIAPYGTPGAFLAPPTPPSEGTATFITPQIQDRPTFLPDTDPYLVRLYRHFANRWRNVIVWRRSDGTYCQDTPTPYESSQTQPAAYFSDDPIGPDLTDTFQTDSNPNYPWNPFPGAGPESPTEPGQYAFLTNWDQTTEVFALDPYLAEWFQPGVTNIITQEEALELTAAGYGDCVS